MTKIFVLREYISSTNKIISDYKIFLFLKLLSNIRILPSSEFSFNIFSLCERDSLDINFRLFLNAMIFLSKIFVHELVQELVHSETESMKADVGKWFSSVS